MDTLATDELLGTICHDLRDPLSSIVMGSSFLLRELPHEASAERARKMVEAIQRAAQRMNRLLSDYNELSRFDRGLVSLEIADHDASELLAAAIEPSREVADASGVKLTSDRPGALRIACDRDRVIDALHKLVANAVRATPAGGSVTLHAEARGDTVHLSVRDTGSGVPKEILPHLFDCKWLATQRARTGAGIGLALVRRVVEAHGGELHVETEPHAGSLFTMTLAQS